jgi:site-specific DNA-methyltransferase (adenine-specific)
MVRVELCEGDNRQSLRRLIDQGVKVHSVVTDPPYGLVSVQKRFGKAGSAAARTEKNDGSFARLSGGFMGKTWDGSGIERDPEFWALIHEILLPGGYCFAFSGSRTSHWQACAMEVSGFVIHPLHGWIYGSGFPKAHAADKAIDKMQGTTASAEAEQWSGWAYGTQAQKPALEPIILAQKPFSEKTGAANLVKHGVGAVNIDGCRVPTGDKLGGGDTNPESIGKKGNEGWERPWMKDEVAKSDHAAKIQGNVAKAEALGRHPANLLHDGSAVVVDLFPDSKGQLAKASSSGRKTQNVYGAMARGSNAAEPRNDSGSAARFFNCFPPDCPPVFYEKKAGKDDRAGSKHPTVKPISLMQHLVRHVTPAGGLVLDPFAGSGTTGEAALREGFNCILMEAEPEYIDFLKERFDFFDPSQISVEQLLA